MQGSRPSSSAQTVTLARAHLTWLGVVEDPFARSLLPWRLSVLEALLRRRPFTRLGRTPTLSFLAARTQFFDDAVREALEEGASQVLIVGAGYDSRAWRLARNGVPFFEVDHSATQADKRSRAPSCGPTYVPADLRDETLIEELHSHGFDSAVRTIFVVEGLTMYLDEGTVARLLADLAILGVAGSRLAVNFTVSGGGSVAPMSRMAAKVIRTTWRARGEPSSTGFSPTNSRHSSGPLAGAFSSRPRRLNWLRGT